jgi:archaellum component FlaC
VNLAIEQESSSEPPVADASGGDGGGFDRRLTRVEEQVRFLSSDVARKSDVEALKTRIESSNTEIEKVRTEIERVRTEIEKVRSGSSVIAQQVSSMKWTFGLGATALAGIVVALIKLLP